MNRIKLLALPLLLAAGVGLSIPNAQAAAQAAPTRMADASLEDMKKMGIDQDDIDQTIRHHSWRSPGNPTGSDSKVTGNNAGDNPGVSSLNDNTREAATDQNDTDNWTYNLTFWALVGLLAVGAVALLAAFRSRRTT